MNEETMEMMEVENEAVESEMDDYTKEPGSGKGLGLVLAGVAGAVAVGAAVYKKLKAKKDDKPRKRKKLMWVEVEDEPAEEDIVDGEAKDIEEEPEKK